MKFIDLYNRNKNTEVFKEKLRTFKAWTRLAKNEPEKYKVVFDNRNYCFNYFENEKMDASSYFTWNLKENSLCGFGKYTRMSDFEK